MNREEKMEKGLSPSGWLLFAFWKHSIWTGIPIKIAASKEYLFDAALFRSMSPNPYAVRVNKI
ncbi:hypothetical protein SAMN04488127_1927 [Bhargavaea ginsengi]|uniref:Uncharacterized protein n=1 Tax=Bhargavaea ginsengi TaxID=426757 RepID=A0A1H6Z831_9BACL|nr:hypothetical protein [Bhargavaea ginsengi]MCM3086870.1 hypothetical protein [Bhargavaea ginsengi]SEJ47567.1 hypothetical protein SAMN04488127_1927 [Bhargavaea ginsengi]